MTMKNSLKSTLKTRIPLFWLVAVIGTVGPMACMTYVEERTTRMYFKGREDEALEYTVTSKHPLCDVESVYDGDTVWVVCNGKREKLRLYCIDAPEMGQTPWGENSRDYLRSIIGGTVRVEAMSVDRYGRTVAKLWRGETDLNAQMILEGQAAVYSKYCPKVERQYYMSQQNARQARRKIWSQSGIQSAPWEWRAKL